MTTKSTTHETKRFRLAGNDNETIVVDRADHRRYRLATNDNETIVDESPASLGARRIRQR
jgi:hypothetical protein